MVKITRVTDAEVSLYNKLHKECAAYKPNLSDDVNVFGGRCTWPGSFWMSVGPNVTHVGPAGSIRPVPAFGRASWSIPGRAQVDYSWAHHKFKRTFVNCIRGKSTQVVTKSFRFLSLSTVASPLDLYAVTHRMGMG